MVPIRVYTQENCNQCTYAKKHIERLGGVYVEEPITDGVLAAAKELGVMQAPIIQFGEMTVGGFNPGFLADAVKVQKENNGE